MQLWKRLDIVNIGVGIAGLTLIAAGILLRSGEYRVAVVLYIFVGIVSIATLITWISRRR